jgi:hypothetical protein
MGAYSGLRPIAERMAAGKDIVGWQSPAENKRRRLAREAAMASKPVKETSQRMAAEEIPEGLDALIASVRGPSSEDRLMADAKAYVNDRFDNFKAVGLSEDDARAFDGLGQLPNGLNGPRELRVNVKPGVEQRRHSQYSDEVNDLTGQVDINPVIDPVTGDAMVTNFGKVGEGLTVADIDGYDQATEYVQQQLGRLGGRKVVRNNDDDFNAPDFMIDGQEFDGETTRPAWNEPAVQMYTKVIDEDAYGGDKYQMAGSIKDKIIDMARQNPEMGIVDIVNKIPSFSGGRNRRGGKQHNPGEGKVLSSKKGIIVTELSNEDHQRNKSKDIHADPIIGAYYQDLDRVYDAVQSLKGNDLISALQVRPNDGHRNAANREPRGRVYIEPPSSMSNQINRDFRDITPLAQQLFDY